MSYNFSLEESHLLMQVPRRLHHVIVHKMNKTKDIDLHKTQIMVLMILKENGPTNMHTLGKMVGMEKGSFTQVIDKLVALGYAERNRDLDDRRSVQVFLSQKGVEATDRIANHVNVQINKILSVLKKTEIEVLIEALKNIEEIVDKIEEKQNEIE